MTTAAVSEDVEIPPEASAGIFEDRARLIQDFHDLYYGTSTNGVSAWRSTTWFGTPVLKNPCDMLVYHELVCEVRPDIIVETGVARGGMALFFHTMNRLMGGEAEYLGIDIKLDGVTEHVMQLAEGSEGKLSFMQGSSTHPKLIAAVAERCKGKRVLVALDSDHNRAHVLDECRLYGHLVSLGSYLIVEDTNIDWTTRMKNAAKEFYPDGGPGLAVRDFINEQPDSWKVDPWRERHLLSFNPGGYLKRVTNEGRKVINEDGSIGEPTFAVEGDNPKD